LKDEKSTIDFVKKIEYAGADWITVHGRTREEKSSVDVNKDIIKLIKENLNIPGFY
jgi:tRNA-dihydrouridine synthase 4